VNVVNAICSTCLAFTAIYGSTSEGARRCFGCKLPGDVSKNKALCRSCFKNRPEYGPTPRKKPQTCSACRTRGQLHRDSDWLWNMLVTRKPRRRRKRKILWSEETLRTQLWWLRPRVKKERTEGDPSASSSSTSSSSSFRPPAALPAHPDIMIKTEPGIEFGGGDMQ
jgi:hypothetical protein